MKHNFLTGVLSLIAIGFGLTGCSSDDLITDSSTPVEKDTNFFINVQIASPAENSTRANDNNSAEDYENGTPDEQKIHEILFVFYNSAYQYVGNTVITPADDQETIPDKGENAKPGSIENIVTITVPVSVPAGSLKPAYVMAYVNPTTGTTDQQRSFDQTLGLTRTLEQMTPQKGNADAGIKAHSGFTMTNSVYYENAAASAPTIAVPISDNQLFTTKETAGAALDTETEEKIIKIYVERVVAKVNLKQTVTNNILSQDNNIIEAWNSKKDGNSEIKYTLEFNALGWGLSNLEKATFLVKNFRTSGNCDNFATPYSLTNMSYSDANNAFSNLTSPAWNMPGNTSGSSVDYWPISGHRSFWAMSPTYFTGATYPTYADETKDSRYKSALEYLSFDDIYNTKLTTPALTSNGKEVTTAGNTIYTLENTAEAGVVTNHQKRGVTCALVIGQYKIKNSDGSNFSEDPTDFFIRQGFDNDGKSVTLVYPNEEQMKMAFLEKNTTIYIYNGEEATPKYSPVPWKQDHSDAPTEYLNDFQIYHPEMAVTDNKFTPNRFVTLKLEKAEGSTNKYYYIDENGEYTEITGTNIGTVNAALYHNLNGVMPAVEKYKSGYAYFSVPIKHLWTKGADGKDLPGIGDDNFSAASLGLYGIVRNHTYTINVQGISGIGTGIGDPSVPIIPTVETDKYFVKTELRVQRWRVVPQQDVILKP